MTTARDLIYKSTLLLGLKNDSASAETALREAIAIATTEGNVAESIEARTFLGELLVDLGRTNEQSADRNLRDRVRRPTFADRR